MRVPRIRVTTTRVEALRNAVPFYPARVVAGFEAEFGAELELFRRIGIHPTSGKQSFEDPYQYRTVVDDFSNVGAHSIAVAFATQALGELISRQGVITAAEVRTATRRALLHDAIKPYCAFLTRARHAGLIDDQRYFSVSVFDPVKEQLTRAGITPELAAEVVDDFGRETNCRLFFQEHLELPVGAAPRLQPHRWVTKLVHFADDMTLSPALGAPADEPTYFVPAALRLHFSESNHRYPWIQSAGLAVTPGGSLSHQEFIDDAPPPLAPLGNYHDLMVWACGEMAAQIISDLRLPPAAKAEIIVQGFINEAVRKLPT